MAYDIVQCQAIREAALELTGKANHIADLMKVLVNGGTTRGHVVVEDDNDEAQRTAEYAALRTDVKALANGLPPAPQLIE